MCLITKNKKFILKEDLYVYKIFKMVNNKPNGLYYRFEYEENTVYNTEIVENSNIGTFTYFDSFASQYVKINSNDKIIDGIKSMDSLLRAGYRSYSEGFHAVLFIERLLIHINRRFFHLIDESFYKCKIAKGSECIIDDTGLIISNSIELIERVSIDDSIEDSYSILEDSYSILEDKIKKFKYGIA